MPIFIYPQTNDIDDLLYKKLYKNYKRHDG